MNISNAGLESRLVTINLDSETTALLGGSETR